MVEYILIKPTNYIEPCNLLTKRDALSDCQATDLPVQYEYLPSDTFPSDIIGSLSETRKDVGNGRVSEGFNETGVESHKRKGYPSFRLQWPKDLVSTKPRQFLVPALRCYQCLFSQMMPFGGRTLSFAETYRLFLCLPHLVLSPTVKQKKGIALWAEPFSCSLNLNLATGRILLVALSQVFFYLRESQKNKAPARYTLARTERVLRQ
jgi:hypothetical protein